MILECPQCSARFLVPDGAIGAAGRTVKCGACKHSWHAMPEAARAAPLIIPDFPADPAPVAPNFSLPAISTWKRSLKPFYMAAPALALCWLMVWLLTSYQHAITWPVASSIYSAFGITPSDGLAFEKTRMERISEGQRTRFVVTGNIVNANNKPRTISSVLVRLVDAQGEEIIRRSYVVNHTVEAGGEYPFRIRNLDTSFGSRVAQVTVDVGNPLQLWFR